MPSKEDPDILARVREAAAVRILFLPHALSQMNAPERMISTGEIRSIIGSGKLVENYPEDVRGNSCLILGFGAGNRPIHVVRAPKGDYLAVITAYLPDSSQWQTDWKTRKKR